MRIWIALVVMVRLGSAAAQTPDELSKMADAHQDFALKDAVEHGGAKVPLFYRGLVEAELNEAAVATRDLKAAIRQEANAQQAFEADEILSNLAFRNGQYHEALSRLEAAHAKKPGDQDANNMLPLFRTLAEAPDMKVVRLKNYSRVDDNDGLPISINGKPVKYGFDTGAALSVLGTADAKMLGLELKHVSTKLSEASGSPVPGADVAVAEEVIIGGLHLRNVPFLVLDDTREPFVHLPVGQRGLIGLPVLIAMKSVRWAPDKWLEFGRQTRVAGPRTRNLMFHGATAIVQVSVNEKPLIFSLDTGAVDTDLNEGFANALPDIVRAGRKEIRPIMGVGGTNSYDSVLLGPVVFRVGRRDVTLKAPHVFPNHSLGKFDGNLGNDILRQAQTVVLDFEAMELKME